MDKPWYRIFNYHQKSDLSATKARADDGDAEAQFSLGLKFAEGDGEEQDYVQAAMWYRKAADQNHSTAQFNLGIMYAKGQGVAVNDGDALMWIRRAAERGEAEAQFNLGNRYHRASFGAQEMEAVESRIEAYKWFQLAMAQGYKGAELACQPVALRMTRADVVEGNNRIAAFMAGKSQGVEAGTK